MCCIVADVLAAVAADMSEKLDTVKVDTVSLPIALGLWLMMWPVLTKVGASARRCACSALDLSLCICQLHAACWQNDSDWCT